MSEVLQRDGKWKLALLPLILLAAMIFGVILYYDKHRCVDDGLTNCNVNSWTFEKVDAGQSYDQVKEILGNKNIVGPNFHKRGSCSQSDFSFFWESHVFLSQGPTVEFIEVGFKHAAVNCKNYAMFRETKMEKEVR